jgi:hypothetical protein
VAELQGDEHEGQGIGGDLGAGEPGERHGGRCVRFLITADGPVGWKVLRPDPTPAAVDSSPSGWPVDRIVGVARSRIFRAC